MNNDAIISALTRAREFVTGFRDDDAQEGEPEAILQEIETALDEVMTPRQRTSDILLQDYGWPVEPKDLPDLADELSPAIAADLIAASLQRK